MTQTCLFGSLELSLSLCFLSRLSNHKGPSCRGGVGGEGVGKGQKSHKLILLPWRLHVSRSVRADQREKNSGLHLTKQPYKGTNKAPHSGTHRDNLCSLVVALTAPPLLLPVRSLQPACPSPELCTYLRMPWSLCPVLLPTSPGSPCPKDQTGLISPPIHTNTSSWGPAVSQGDK